MCVNFLPWKQRKYKTPNYNNLAHLPIIISSKTRATKRTNTTTTKKTTTTKTTTPNRTSSFINNGYDETVAALTSATPPPPFGSSRSSSTTFLATANVCGNINFEDIDDVDEDDNGNNDCGCTAEDNGNHVLHSSRNKNEIRITENPIPEAVVC